MRKKQQITSLELTASTLIGREINLEGKMNIISSLQRMNASSVHNISRKHNPV